MLAALQSEYESLGQRVGTLELDELRTDFAALGQRVSALETPRQRIRASDFRLVGGWRIAQEFAQCGMAIDWVGRRVFASGHSQQNVIHEYALPDQIGAGSNVNGWPILTRTGTHQTFWGGGYSGGIRVADDVLWVSAKVYYDTAPKPLVIYGKNLSTGEIVSKPTNLQQPAFGGGFIKGAADTLIGCGGYESGQGSVFGPTCAREDGTIFLNQPSLNNGTWDNRTPRPPNYSIVEGNPEWLGINPRDGEGRWCCDRVYGGGIWRRNGLCYWALLGTGPLSYAYQTEMFSLGSNKECWLYTYDPQTFDGVRYERWPHGMVHGTEIDSSGRVYLHTRDEWGSGMYTVDSAIKVFEVAA